MSISNFDRDIFSAAGFLDSEIKEIAEAKTLSGADQPPIDINSHAWAAVLKSRIDWWDDKRDRGWTESEIIAELENYYRRDKKRSPFDFLKAAYRPPKKLQGGTYIEAVRKSHTAKIAKSLPGYHSNLGGRYRGKTR